MNKYGILITAYKQVDLTRKCIENFNRFANANNFIFVIVSTSEIAASFKEIGDDYKNAYAIEWFDAPRYTSNFCKVKRILLSIRMGLLMFEELGVDKVLHLHSDTYWQTEKENELMNLFSELSNYMIIGDIDVSGEKNDNLPKGLHFHPEGLMLNLNECKKYGYGFNFEKAFLPLRKYCKFQTHNENSIEAMLGQLAAFSLTNENFLDNSKPLPQIYHDKVKINLYRDYHGVFENGLVNVKTVQ